MSAADLMRTPDPDNLAWKLVENLLPVDTATGFTVGLAHFAPPLILIASLFLGWHIIAGIVASAYTGKVLGERWHQIWAPLRVVAGFGFLLPVTASGLATVHLLERLMFQVGTNVADTVAIASASHVIKEGNFLTPISAGGRELAWQIVGSEVCTATYRNAVARTVEYSGETAPTQQPPVEGRLAIKPAKDSWVPGGSAPAKIEGFVWDYGEACGSFRFSMPTIDEFGTFGEDRKAAIEALITEVREIDVPKGIVRTFKVQPSWTHDDLEQVDWNAYIDRWKVAGMLVPDLVGKMNVAGDKFDAAVSAAAAKAGSEQNGEAHQKLMDGLEEHGWVLLSSYHRILSSINEVAAAYASERAAYIEPNPEAWGTYKNEVTVAVELIKSQVRVESNRLAVDGDDLATVGEKGSLFAKVINSISKPVLDYFTNYDGWRQDPVGDLIAVGNRLSVGGQTGFAVALAATTASNFWSSTAGKVVDFMMVPGWWAIGIAVVAGSLLSYVLPLMPYIFTIFALGALAMDLIVFAIAGTLWAFMHIRMDGGEFADQAQSFGYHALFSLLLRQPITVLGLLAAQSISVVLLNIFLMTWNFAFQASQGDTAIGFLGILISVGMMLFIQWHILLRLYGLILELPTRVGAYFGSTVQGWGDTEHGNTVIASSSAQISANTPSAPRTSPATGNSGGRNGIAPRGKK